MGRSQSVGLAQFSLPPQVLLVFGVLISLLEPTDTPLEKSEYCLLLFGRE